MKRIKDFNSFNEPLPAQPISIKESIDENVCPECEEEYTSQCKCMTTHKKTLEDLKRGHGKTCPNGHTWSYDTPDGKVIILK